MKRFISFITTFTTKHPHWPKWLGGTFATLALIGYGRIVLAAPWWEDVIDYVSGRSLLKAILGTLFSFISMVLTGVSNLFIWIINDLVLPGQNSLFFGNGDQVGQLKIAYDVMLNIANGLFFAILLVFAVMIIIRRTGYNFKKAVIALITAIALANISYQLVQILIEAGDALRNSASHLPGLDASSTGTFSTWISQFGTLLNVNVLVNGDVSVFKYLFASFTAMAFQAIIVWILYRLTFVLIERAIRLAILTIFAPIQAVLGVLPEKAIQIGDSNWFSDVIRWILVLPVTFILIGVAKAIAPFNSVEALQQFLSTRLFVVGGINDVSTTNVGSIMYLIICLGVLIAAGNTPALLKVPVSAMTKFFTDKLPEMAWKPIKADLSARGKDMLRKGIRGTAWGRAAYDKVVAVRGKREKEIKAQQGIGKKEDAATVNRAVSDRYQADNKNVELAVRAKIGINISTEEWINSAPDDQEKKNRKEQVKNARKGLENTALGQRSAESEKMFMGAINETVADELEKQFPSADVAEKLKDAIGKLKANPDDKEAAFDMMVLSQVLRRYSVSLRKEQAEEAMDYFNDLVSSNQSLFRDAGMPRKFSLDQLRRGGQTEDSGSGPAFEQELKAQRELEKMKSLHDDLKVSNPSANNEAVFEQQAGDNLVNALNGLTQSLNAGQVVSLNKGDLNALGQFSAEQHDRLNGKDTQDKLKEILGGSSLSDDDKANSVREALGYGGAGAEELAQTIVKQGFAPESLSNIQSLLSANLSDSAKGAMKDILSKNALSDLDNKISTKTTEIKTIRETTGDIGAAQPGIQSLKATIAKPDFDITSFSSEVTSALNSLEEVIKNLGPGQTSTNTRLVDLSPTSQQTLANLFNKFGNRVDMPGAAFTNNGDAYLSRIHTGIVGLTKIIREQG